MIQPRLHQKKSANGFTIVELLIATAVFSLVLVVSIVGFLQIGQIFYKGVTATRTHEATRNTINSIASDMRFASQLSQTQDLPTGVGSSRYFCAGSHRYTYNPGQMVDSSNPNSIGLVKETLDVSGSCGNPRVGGNLVFDDSAEELLGNRMRVSEIQIRQLPSPYVDLYTVRVKIAYGDNNTLQNAMQPNVSCGGGLRNSQYCQVSELRTTIKRGF